MSMPVRRRTVLAPFLLVAMLLTPMKPAAASPLDGTLDDLFGHVEQAVNDAKSYLKETVSGYLEAIPDELDGVLNTALGELGLMDPNQARLDITHELQNATDGDLAQSDPIQAGQELANELDRQITRAQVDTVLSNEGQTATRHKLSWVEDTLGQVEQHATSAQSAVSTQEAIKQMAQQNARHADVLGAVQSELVQSRQDNQLTNLNLTNISQSLDQQTRARQLQGLGNALDTLKISAQARLF